MSVFLSYAHADKSTARLLAKELRKAGLRVWVDEGELRTGDSIIARIADAILEVQYVVALVSESSVSSKWCSKELSLAVNHGLREGHVRVLPLRLDNVQMPSALEDVMYLQMRSTAPTRIVRRLIKDVRLHRKEFVEKQRISRYELTVQPLASTSCFTAKQLKRMVFELTSQRLNERYETGDDAMEMLMKDYSVPAMQALYQAALIDARAKSNMGYGLAGLMFLAPITAPWIRKLLAHRNRNVFSNALTFLISRDVSSYALRDTFRRVKDSGDWMQFKKQFRSNLKGSAYSGWMRELIRDTEVAQG